MGKNSCMKFVVSILRIWPSLYWKLSSKVGAIRFVYLPRVHYKTRRIHTNICSCKWNSIATVSIWKKAIPWFGTRLNKINENKKLSSQWIGWSHVYSFTKTNVRYSINRNERKQIFVFIFEPNQCKSIVVITS